LAGLPRSFWIRETPSARSVSPVSLAGFSEELLDPGDALGQVGVAHGV